MERAGVWLKREIKGVRVIPFAAFMGFVSLVTVVLIAKIISKIINIPYEDVGRLGNQKGFALVAAIISAAFIEELIFRGVPFIAAYMFTKGTRLESKARAFVLLFFSVYVFGLAHGSLLSVLIQGTAGFFFGIVFLKCGGAGGNFRKAIFASTICHSTYNLIIYLPLLAVIFYA